MYRCLSNNPERLTQVSLADTKISSLRVSQPNAPYRSCQERAKKCKNAESHARNTPYFMYPIAMYLVGDVCFGDPPAQVEAGPPPSP